MTSRSVLLVGAGVIGHRHMQAATRFGDHISAVVDGDRARADAAASQYGAAAFSTLTEALAASPVDVIVIATPSPQHHAQAIEALANGADVLVEKPHRVPGDSADELAAAVADASGRYVIGMTTRHWPGVRAAASAVANGDLGTVLSYSDRMHFTLAPDALPAWYFVRESAGGGVLLTNGVHAIDRARALLGSDLTVVASRLVTVFADHEVEDSAELRLVSGDGVPVDLSMLWSPADAFATGVTITGTAGFAHVEMDGSWVVKTTSSHTHGGPVSDQQPFDLQWDSFSRAESGFGFDELEPSIALIEQCYRESAS